MVLVASVTKSSSNLLQIFFTLSNFIEISFINNDLYFSSSTGIQVFISCMKTSSSFSAEPLKTLPLSPEKLLSKIHSRYCKEPGGVKEEVLSGMEIALSCSLKDGNAVHQILYRILCSTSLELF